MYFKKESNTRKYMLIILFIQTYYYELWTTTSTSEKRLRTFSNKIWIIICGPIYENGVRVRVTGRDENNIGTKNTL